MDREEIQKKLKEEREKKNKSIIDRLKGGGHVNNGFKNSSFGSGYKKIEKDKKAMNKLFNNHLKVVKD